VTASVLNVRARPGVSASNPPVGSLRAGEQVTIYEEAQVAGDNWYRIGVNRWVAARYVRLIASVTTNDDSRATGAFSLPFGWVVPDKLDVRNKPGVGSGSVIVDRLDHYRVVPVLEEATVGGARWYGIGDQRWVEARQIGVARRKSRPASIPASALWVAVNLSQQTVVCYEGDRAVYAALAATGLPGTPTVQGIFRTWRRLDTGKMSGPGYYIEDVTWTCYFYSGYALHTAYWHDKFGRPRSHGCVNLSPYDAWWIHQWSAKGGPNSPTVYSYWA
jgi:lipoprotein-anchoring transpeptidase ErfK/SrfK